MTTVSTATSTSAYSYTKSATSASKDTSSCITVSAQKATSVEAVDDDASDSAEKLMSQLMAMMMGQSSGGATTSDSQDDGETDAGIAAMDADGDGIVSKAEFVAARPSDVSEDQAGTLFDSFDSAGAGSLSVSALSEAMSAQKGGQGEPPPASDDEDDDDQLGSLFDALDANGDGVLTPDEFLSQMSADTATGQEDDLFALLDRSAASPDEDAAQAAA